MVDKPFSGMPIMASFLVILFMILFRLPSDAIPVFSPERPERVIEAVNKNLLTMNGSMNPQTISNGLSMIKGNMGIRKDLKQIRKEKPEYVDARLGYRIYGSKTVSRYLGLRILEEFRSPASMLRGLSSRDKVRDLEAWGLKLSPTTRGKVPSVPSVVSVIKGMELPKGSLSNLTIFILPLSMENTSGLSWPDTMVIGSRPSDYESMQGQLEFTVAHEIGHILHYRFMGRENSGNWQEYQTIRRIRGWRSGGQALTEDWKNSVQECFAEDVRILLSKGISAEPEQMTVYGDPRDMGISDKLKNFFEREFTGERQQVVAEREPSAFTVFKDVRVNAV